MNNDLAIEVQNLSKTFRVPHEKVSSLKSHATRLFQRVPVTKYKVLDDISFNVKKGEFFSIVGANGSGKSTMLKLLAGIYTQDSGTILHNGSMSTMIELGVGFNFELSGRDNIFLNASLFGMTRSAIELVYDKIVRFAEIEDFIDQKVKNYSSGMQVRLAFAIAIQAQSDIMIVDEVLAVGDANFQQKCFDVFRELKAQGKTIVFVSHDLQSVRDFSDRVLLLDDGKQVGIYAPEQAISEYQKINSVKLDKADFSPIDEATNSTSTEKPTDKTKPHIVSVEMSNIAGEKIKSIESGSNVFINLKISNPTKEMVEVGISLIRNDGLYCFGTNTYIEKIKVPTSATFTANMKINNISLQKGSYYIVAGVFSKNCRRIYEIKLRAKNFRITQNDLTEGLVSLNHDWRF